MKIPIYNSIFYNSRQNLKTNSLDFKILNNLNLKKVEKNKFPLVRLIQKLPNNSSLYETVLIQLMII